MAKVFSGVDGIKCPDFQWEDREKYQADFKSYKDKLAEFCKSQSKCPDAGVIIRFQVADGYAQYMIKSYTQLIHINEDDGYHFNHVGNLNKAGILQEIKSAKLLETLFKPQIQAV